MTLPGDQGYTGVDVDGAGIDMYPEMAGKMMTDIAQVLTDAQTGWANARAKIESLEGKLGDGPMGKAMSKNYDPAAKKLGELITDMVERLDKLSAAGTKAVPLYLGQDRAAGQHFEF